MRKSVLSLGVAACALTSSPGWAQSMDYGAMEEIFGQPVTMSATGSPQKVSEVPVNMEIITQDDIRRSGADNIPDILQFMTGINYRRSSFNDGEVSIRGYDQPWNPRLLVLVNNRPVYEDFYGDVVWSALPVQLDEIRQIEVVKGPNSALFGFNAASGVINIITYNPLHDNINAMTVRTGSQDLREGSVVATAGLSDKFGVRLSAGGMRAHEFTTDGNVLPAANVTGLLRPQSDTFNIDAKWQIADGVELTLEGGAGEMQRNFPADDTEEHDRTRTLRARLSAETALGLFDVDAYQNIWNINYTGGQAQQAVNISNDFRVSDLFKIGTDHTFRLGAEYKYNQAQGEFFNWSTIDYTVYSTSAMWNWQVTPRLSMTNAVREDYLLLGMKGQLLSVTGQLPADFNDSSLSALSSNSGLVYQVSDQDVVRLMGSRGYQLPSLNDLGQQIYTPGQLLLGDPHLRPTAVLNYEIDYDHTFPQANTVLRTAAFRQYNSGLFGYDISSFTSGGTTIYQSANIGRSNEVGTEIALKSANTQGFRWDAGYSFAEISDQINSITGVYSSYAGSTPLNTVDLGVGYTLGSWEADTKARWQDRFTDYLDVGGTYESYTIKNYITMNARIGYKINDHFTVAGTVDQLNRAEILERISVPSERRFIFSATARF